MTNLEKYIDQNPIKSIACAALVLTLTLMAANDSFRAVEDRYCIDSLNIGKHIGLSLSPHCQALYSLTPDQYDHALVETGSRESLINSLKVRSK